MYHHYRVFVLSYLCISNRGVVSMIVLSSSTFYETKNILFKTFTVNSLFSASGKGEKSSNRYENPWQQTFHALLFLKMFKIILELVSWSNNCIYFQNIDLLSYISSSSECNCVLRLLQKPHRGAAVFHPAQVWSTGGTLAGTSSFCGSTNPEEWQQSQSGSAWVTAGWWGRGECRVTEGAQTCPDHLITDTNTGLAFALITADMLTHD